MQPVWIAVAVLFAVGLTVLLCVGIASMWYLLLQMRKMQQAADGQASVMRELLGDGSIANLSKAARAIAAGLPDVVETIAGFNRSMAAFTKIVFTQQAPAATVAPGEEESAFYPYTDEHAAQAEVVRRNKESRFDLTKEQMASMRTETKKPVPAEQLPPKPPESETELTATAL